MAIKNSYNNLNRFSVVGKRFVVGFSETIRQYFIDYRYRHCYIIRYYHCDADGSIDINIVIYYVFPICYHSSKRFNTTNHTV